MFAALNAFQTGGGGTRLVDVFSTTLYTGNGSSQTITNGIDLSTNGGLVWCKNRDSASNHWLSDTERGINQYLQTQNTDASTTLANSFTAFNSNGFSIGSNGPNDATKNYVSWTFRQAPRFFDVVTWAGDNSSTRQINHNLGTTPAFILIKRTDTAADWIVGARKDNNTYSNLRLNSTAAELGSFGAYPSGSGFTSDTQLGIGYWSGAGQATLAETNESGGTYVAYLFAHNAGGFGSYGSDNVISCGSYTGSSGSGQSINLGYKPQWLLVKNTSRASTNWVLMDKYRNFDNTGYGWIYANSSAAEDAGTGTVYVYPTSTGFTTVDPNANTDYLSDSYIYIAVKDNS